MNYQFLIKIADEFLESLKKPLSKEFSMVEKIFLKYDIVPLPTSDNNNKKKQFGESFINKGEYSYVFNVIYKGKERVAKITTNERDMNNIAKLHQLSEKVGKFKKHICKVYEVIHHSDNNFKNLYIIIVEKLVPLNTYIKDLFDFPDYENKDIYQKSKLLKTLNESFFLNSFIKFGLNKLYKRIELIDLSIKAEKYFKNSLQKVYEKYIKTNIVEEYEIIKITKYFFNNNIALNYDINVKICNYIFQYIKNIFNDRMYFSSELPAKTPFIFPQQLMPETRNFFQFLLFLNKKFGIEYSDLHSDNIMERPETKDLVISDPGLFKGL